MRYVHPLFAVVCLALVSLLRTQTMAQNLPSLKEMILRDPYSGLNAAIRVQDSMPDTNPWNASTPGRQIVINTCAWSDNWGRSTDDAFITHIKSIAFHHVFLSRQLSAEKYPRDVWTRPLTALAEAQIAEIVERRNLGRSLRDVTGIHEANIVYERRLASALNAYRSQYDRSKPTATAGALCGGDWIGYVKLTTTPPGGTINVIGAFDYKLCQANGIPPYSGRCPWELVALNQQIPQGDYHYLARWLDGAVECGRVGLYRQGQASDRAETLAIGKTGKVCSQ